VDTTVDRISPGVAVLALEGELDASNFRDVIALGSQLYDDGARRLVLDLAELSYMASSGIVAIHSLVLIFRGHQPPDPDAGWEAIHATGLNPEELVDEVRLVAPQPNIDRVLERTGLKRMLPVHPDRESAVV
jgi:anti-anti-sigma regulatory factor